MPMWLVVLGIAVKVTAAGRLTELLHSPPSQGVYSVTKSQLTRDVSEGG